MKLKYAALGCGMLLANLHAQAQSNVQVYGALDVALEHVTHSHSNGGSLDRMPSSSGGIMPSRLGFRGNEDIGNDLKMIFTLETGFSPDTGVMGQGNRLFGRQAWVGVAGGWGQVTLGRNYSMLFSSFADTDVIGPAQFSIGSLDAYLPNARHDNSIAYRGSLKGATLGLTYSLGRDASAAGGPTGTNCPGENAADKKACRNWSASLKYDGSNWGVIGAYDTYRGGAGALAAFGPTSSAQSDTRKHAGAYVKFGDFKLAGGYVRRDNEGAAAPRSNLSYLGVSYWVTPVVSVDAQVSRLDVRGTGRRADLAAVRARYHVSKRTSVYAMIGAISNEGNSAVPLSAGGSVGSGMSQNGVLTGMLHTF